MKTDLDLPEAYRTQANLWKAKYFEMRAEVVKANKGIKRLRRKLEKARLHLEYDEPADGPSWIIND